MKINNEHEYNNVVNRINYLLYREGGIGLENDEADELLDLVESRGEYESRNDNVQVQKSESKFYKFFENIRRLWQ